MNQYAAMAERHWRRWLPSRVAAMDDPSSFFSNLGQEVAAQIEDLTADLAGDDPPGETFMEKVGRLNMARLRAEEIVLPETAAGPPVVSQAGGVGLGRSRLPPRLVRSSPVVHEERREAKAAARRSQPRDGFGQ